MDKNAIKRYAVWARRELIEKVSQKAMQYGIEEGMDLNPDLDSVNGVLLTDIEKKQRQALIGKVKAEGYTQVMEEIAFTWFNRFIALRFMEVNGYLPSHVRVFTDESNNFKPQILTEALHLDFENIDKEKILEMKQANRDEELFKYLLILQCNNLSSILPGMFQKIADYTELLLPDYLLRDGNVLEQLVSVIPEDNWTDQVQIIGWLYQYYNLEKKDEVFAALKKKVKISKDNIPAATQLFTPDWIVRYMVENSLGRIWKDGRPESDISKNWRYYLDEAEQVDVVRHKMDRIRRDHTISNPEDIKIIDPCMGSGHVLVYAFEVLMSIYEDAGYSQNDASKSIVENNIFGLDIDDRAGQLAYFAILMMARKYNRRILREQIKANVYSIPETQQLNEDAIAYFIGGRRDIKNEVEKLLDCFSEGKEYGSLIDTSDIDNELLLHRISEIQEMEDDNVVHIIYKNEIKNTLLPIIEISRILAQKYDVVITNPPYMGSSGMGKKLNEYIKKNYPNSKNDLFSVFIERCGKMLKKNGYQAMITQHSWMFLSKYEKMRLALNSTVINMVHLGARAFEEIGGEVVQTTSFVLMNQKISDYNGTYIRLVDEESEQKKEEAFFEKKKVFVNKQDNYEKIPGNILAYWISDKVMDLLENSSKLEVYGKAKQGLATTDNNLYLRLWQEVDYKKIDFECRDCSEIKERHSKWFPYNKAGGFRKWSMISEYVVNYENDGESIKNAVMTKYPYLNNPGFVVKNTDSYFKHGITWNDVSTGAFCCRYVPDGYIYDAAGPMYFSDNDKVYLGYFNSSVFQMFADIICQGLHYSTGHIPNIPYIKLDADKSAEVEALVEENINLSKEDWDSFEGSWDFKCHPLITCAQSGDTIEQAFERWKEITEERFAKLKENEERLNIIFAEHYDLLDEVSCSIEDDNISVKKADLERDIKSLVSYAVGCMFGRYSLEEKKLIQDWTENKNTFDKDNIIPICDDEYFDDDITALFIDFIKQVFGEKNLEENLSFIANALGEKGSPRQAIRKYFLSSFFKDHCDTYSAAGSGKRPIYWLFDSGKNNGFKCLIYMHRYQPDTIARIRTDYVHEQQARYRTLIEELDKRIASSDGSEKVAMTKRLNTLKRQSEEIGRYEEKIHHIADQMISIDLDDGIKENYAKLQDVLAKIK